MAVVKDVAALAGVSTGTVSKYFNNPRGLKEKTRFKVEQAVKELNYRPSPLARSMRTGKTFTIAVIVPDIINPFFTEVYASIRSNLVQKGYIPVLYTTEDDIEILKGYLSGISQRQADGVILCFLDEDASLDSFLWEIRSEMPVVLISWDISNTMFDSVVIDVFKGILVSTSHLIELGHRKIAYVSGPEESHISKQKLGGYLEAMRRYSLDINYDYILYGNYNLSSGYKAARELMMLPEPPTAIVGANDILALGCMKYLLQSGMRIPDDVAVLGFDNISLSSMYEPPLSTISLPINQIGEEAINMLLLNMEAKAGQNRQIILETQLIIRNSTNGSKY
jgi:LacI family transcriptional regulator, repressor for deo operon, udp, cdd, tsx, nupC, and nupG